MLETEEGYKFTDTKSKEGQIYLELDGRLTTVPHKTLPNSFETTRKLHLVEVSVSTEELGILGGIIDGVESCYCGGSVHGVPGTLGTA